MQIPRLDELRLTVYGDAPITVIAHVLFRPLAGSGPYATLHQWQCDTNGPGSPGNTAVIGPFPEGIIENIGITTGKEKGRVWAGIYGYSAGPPARNILVCNGYVGDSPLVYRNGQTIPSQNLDTHLIHRAISNPAAGADLVFTNVPGEAWEDFSLFGRLVTSATVATRQVLLLLNDPIDGTLIKVPAPTTQLASTTVDYLFGPAGYSTYQTSAAGNFCVVGVPDKMILSQIYWPGDSFSSLLQRTLETSTINKQAGDQWSLLRLSGKRRLTGGI
jgi:hypothetical protein